MAKMLAHVQDAMSYMGMSEHLLEDAAGSLESAIRSAQIRLETGLGTRLLAGTGVDVFYLDPQAFSGVQPDGYFRLQCAQGFLGSTGTSLHFLGSLTVTDLLGEPLSSDWVVDRRTGVVYIKKEHASKYVKVEYTSGFTGPDDLATKEPWLTEALLAYVPMVLAGRRDTSADNSKVRNQGDIGEAIIARYTRNIGFTLRPALSDWTPAGD